MSGFVAFDSHSHSQFAACALDFDTLSTIKLAGDKNSFRFQFVGLSESRVQKTFFSPPLLSLSPIRSLHQCSSQFIRRMCISYYTRFKAFLFSPAFIPFDFVVCAWIIYSLPNLMLCHWFLWPYWKTSTRWKLPPFNESISVSVSFCERNAF